MVVGVAFVGTDDRPFGQNSSFNSLKRLMSASEAAARVNSTGSPLAVLTRCTRKP